MDKYRNTFLIYFFSMFLTYLFFKMFLLKYVSCEEMLVDDSTINYFKKELYNALYTIIQQEDFISHYITKNNFYKDKIANNKIIIEFIDSISWETFFIENSKQDASYIKNKIFDMFENYVKGIQMHYRYQYTEYFNLFFKVISFKTHNYDLTCKRITINELQIINDIMSNIKNNTLQSLYYTSNYFYNRIKEGTLNELISNINTTSTLYSLIINNSPTISEVNKHALEIIGLEITIVTDGYKELVFNNFYKENAQAILYNSLSYFKVTIYDNTIEIHFTLFFNWVFKFSC